uniref:Uncharacterized protein n=1 Tax=Steinernema glaseri TaxID=37863 RepID=A0A1I7YU52_9BILA
MRSEQFTSVDAGVLALAALVAVSTVAISSCSKKRKTIVSPSDPVVATNQAVPSTKLAEEGPQELRTAPSESPPVPGRLTDTQMKNIVAAETKAAKEGQLKKILEAEIKAAKEAEEKRKRKGCPEDNVEKKKDDMNTVDVKKKDDIKEYDNIKNEENKEDKKEETKEKIKDGNNDEKAEEKKSEKKASRLDEKKKDKKEEKNEEKKDEKREEKKDEKKVERKCEKKDHSKEEIKEEKKEERTDKKEEKAKEYEKITLNPKTINIKTVVPKNVYTAALQPETKISHYVEPGRVP